MVQQKTKVKEEIGKITERRSTNELLERIDYRLGLRMTALRGFVYGVFHFVGATLGVAILFFIFSRILQGIERIPFVGENQIIKIVLQEVEKQSPSGNNYEIEE
jgi:hypothetical protein